MNWPQVTLIVLFAAVITINLLKHGEPRGEYNIWATLVGLAIQSWLLISGGFFNQSN